MTRAQYDCANRRCSRYHETSEHRYRDEYSAPRCASCRHPLRLLRVRRPMPEAVRARLRAQAVQS